MAETEERSLDNFFAKRDKKKKKERSNRAASAAGVAGGSSGAAGAASGSSGAASAAGGGAGAGARPGDGGTTAAAGPGPATKALTKVRGQGGRESGPGPRACAHVPAPACRPAWGSVGEGPPGPAGRQAGWRSGSGSCRVTRASHCRRSRAPRGTPATLLLTWVAWLRPGRSQAVAPSRGIDPGRKCIYRVT